MKNKTSDVTWLYVLLPIAVVGGLYKFFSGLSAIPAILQDIFKFIVPLAVIVWLASIFVKKK